MKYTLITGSGRIMMFYLSATAECYRSLYGGCVITETVLVEKEVYAAVC